MAVVGGVVGGLVGFGIGLLITEVIIGNPADQSGVDWAFWTDIVLAIAGAIVGVALARRTRDRRTHRAAAR
ncbi:MAG TPA: hypothetical protein VFK76_00630 [Gaiellaceae bacterium]|nr:hypothetical protein [Gaiellaceae bacterium]